MASPRIQNPSIGILALLLLATLQIPTRAELLPIKTYTVAEGLAHNQINKIVRDSRGFLWFCTAEGLSRFDGYNFTNYTTDHGLPHRNVTDFLEAPNGEFWIGTNAGLVRFDPKGTPANRILDANEAGGQSSPMFSVVLPPDEERQAKVVNVLLAGRDGTIWCGTMKHLYRLERTSGRFELVRMDLGNSNGHPREIHILDLLEDRNGSLWVASFGWLCRRWPDCSSNCYNQHDGLPDENFHDLLEDHQGRLWAGTRAHGFFQFTTDGTHAPPVVVRRYAAHDGLTTNWISQLLETSDGRLWVATNRGFAEFFPDGERGRQFHAYGQKNGLLYYGVNTLSEDPDGNLWLASDAGAMKLAREGFVSHGEHDGLLSVYAIFGDRAGGVYFRASVFGDQHVSVFEDAKSDLLHPLENYYTRYGYFDGQLFTWLKPDAIDNSRLGWVGEMVTLQARNGEWWLGTAAGVYRFPASHFTQLKRARPLVIYTTNDGLSALQTFRLFEDSRGDIWASSILPNGIARWGRAIEKWHDLTNAANMPSPKENLARSFGEDRFGNVWIGFDTGVARYSLGRIAMFTGKEGLPAGAVQHIYPDSSGRLWLASSRSGLIRVDNPGDEHPAFKPYATSEGLSSDSAEAITEDIYGMIYVGTGRGLDRLDPRTGNVKHFTTADGLSGGKILTAFRDRSGALWFGTSKGLSHYIPSPDEATKAPLVLINNLHLENVPQPLSALGENEIHLPDLAPNRNQLRIDFVGLSYAPGEVLHYQYRLEGSDADWSTPTEQRNVNYANLAPGRYRFTVRAINSEGVVSPAPATITFTVLRPVWERWWFLALAVTAVLLVVFAFYRYRMRRLFEVANIRTRIATDLHDDIGANLTKIAILSEVARQQSDNGDAEADGPLLSIARISRESVAAMGDIVWAINPQRDSLRDLVRRMRQHAEEVCLSQYVDLIFRTPESERHLKLGVDIRRDIYLIFKEAVNNAVRHSDCTRLEIEIAQQGGMLALIIRDNGKGFDPESEVSGNGLINMRRRVETHAGTIAIESRAGAGTTIEVRLTQPASRRLLPTQTRR